MSESDGEQAARSVALEQAYVHEVYEQCAEKTAQSRHWPRIYKFLEELEPGALVCDIGCGNGKYLSVNDNVFKVGADRCKRLTDIAREKENEVLICDNLALPFRDESFDAVLSIAVVHHFATTERRVNALKELARVLRIGGRLVISVWAMEQRHRKFESQDVLVPWPKAYCLNSGSNAAYPGGKSSAGAIPCINELDPDCRFAQKSPPTSKRNDSRKCKRRSYWIDPIFSPSPSTSSLSSPNETCYSFFRRALQKLAGGKRDSGNRAWFLETWQNGGSKNHRNLEMDDIGDVDDIPIELRRLEDDNVTVSNKLPDAHSIKSKSLGDILEIQRLDLVRSRSSIPGFSSSLTSEFYLDEESKAPSTVALDGGPNWACRVSLSAESARSADEPEVGPSSASSSPARISAGLSSSSIQPSSGSFSSKPRLVKQKTHIPDDASIEFVDSWKNTAIQEFIKGVGEFENSRTKRGNVQKQSSMNEELMSMERLMERERVRRNIMKQASLNEEIICKPSRTFGNFRDTLYSGNATKRLQLIKSGLTNRLKQSTTSMEKVSSMALKNGFVKILQGWKSAESNVDCESERCNESSTARKTSASAAPGASANGALIAATKPEVETIERRLSKEDGSDSSKDSSLQSDTSVDSEDSFASVIYVPKQQPHHNYHQNSHQLLHYEHQFPSLMDVASVPVGAGYQLRTTSAPPSPRIKHPPEILGPRLKLISISPLLKQFPATSKSLPPPSPPRNFNLFGAPSSTLVASFATPSVTESSSLIAKTAEPEAPAEQKAANFPETDINKDDIVSDEKQDSTELLDANSTCGESIINEPEVEQSKATSLLVTKQQNNEKISTNIEIVDGSRCRVYNETKDPKAPSVNVFFAAPVVSDSVAENKSDKSSSESINDEDSRGSRLKQIKELLKQKPGFATRCGKSSFPLVRRASTATSGGRPEAADARTLPRLLSLELFNPETDDLDSDSSGLSSPESVGSVISVISDERFVLKNKEKNGATTIGREETSSRSNEATTLSGDSDKTVKGLDEQDNNTSESSQQSLVEKPAVAVMNDNERFDRKSAEISQVPIDQARETRDLSRIQSTHRRLSETNLIDSYVARSGAAAAAAPETAIDLSSRINSCKYSQLMDDTIAWLRGATATENDYHYSEYTDNNSSCVSNEQDTSNEETASLRKSTSEETMDFVMVTKNGECMAGGGDQEKRLPDKKVMTVGRGDSHESTEIEGSMSLSSDATSQTGSLNTSRFCGGSTTCLVSGNAEYKTLRERRKYLYQKRSASEEIPGSGVSTPPTARLNGASRESSLAARGSRSLKSINMSGSSSQDSLISGNGGGGGRGGETGSSGGGGGGGAITYHQYYHVFREGELDQLINKYVENLHIISSYYDHASWCIVAEKVQVWTI